jgi:rhamnosyltransferase
LHPLGRKQDNLDACRYFESIFVPASWCVDIIEPLVTSRFAAVAIDMKFEPNELTSGREVCAVAVTYHPDADFRSRFSRILRQVARLVIVDNGSNEVEIKMLQELAASPLITLVLNFDNFGIARALNIGIQRAITLGFRCVLLLDQDSCINDDMVQTLIAVRAAYPERNRLAVIGSGFRTTDKTTGQSTDDSGGWEEAESVITSGSLITLETHAAIGAFREEFFIDYVDTEYCFRARAKGYRVIRTRKTIMSHSIGAITHHRMLWLNKWTFNHTPDRRYYIARNDTVMLREYGHYVMGLWALKSLGRCVRLCKRIALYEDMKIRKIMAVAQGWWHGIRGHMGPRPHRHSKSLTGAL